MSLQDSKEYKFNITENDSHDDSDDSDEDELKDYSTDKKSLSYLDEFQHKFDQFEIRFEECCNKNNYHYKEVKKFIEKCMKRDEIKLVIFWGDNTIKIITDDFKDIVKDINELGKKKIVAITLGFENEKTDERFNELFKNVHIFNFKGEKPNYCGMMEGFMRMEEMSIIIGIKTGLLEENKIYKNDFDDHMMGHFM